MNLSPDTWIMLVAIIAAVSCGLVGTWLVLRQNAMLGDAISHSVLPGLVLAFLISQSRDVLPMVIGAGVMGLGTAWLTEMLGRTGRLYRDAALGIVFTLLFAIGVILVSIYTGQIDLDQDCVLYGEIAYAPWDRIAVGSTDLGPRSFWILSGALLVVVLFSALFYHQLMVTSFDPALARAVGVNERFWHYALMTVVSLVIVAAFESVGAILVVAMLILPSATGKLISHRMRPLVVTAIVVAIVTAIGGVELADRVDGSIAGAMTVVGGVIFVLVAITSRLIQRHRQRHEYEAATTTQLQAPGDSAIRG